MFSYYAFVPAQCAVQGSYLQIGYRPAHLVLGSIGRVAGYIVYRAVPLHTIVVFLLCTILLGRSGFFAAGAPVPGWYGDAREAYCVCLVLPIFLCVCASFGVLWCGMCLHQEPLQVVCVCGGVAVWLTVVAWGRVGCGGVFVLWCACSSA
jgi:hypothetical protein